jgi:hypothetical protein
MCLRRNLPDFGGMFLRFKVHWFNPKHLYPKLNSYGDNGENKVWFSCGSTYCTCFSLNVGCGYIERERTQQSEQAPNKKLELKNITVYVSCYTETCTTGMLFPPNVWSFSVAADVNSNVCYFYFLSGVCPDCCVVSVLALSFSLLPGQAHSRCELSLLQLIVRSCKYAFCVLPRGILWHAFCAWILRWQCTCCCWITKAFSRPNYSV